MNHAVFTGTMDRLMSETDHENTKQALMLIRDIHMAQQEHKKAVDDLRTGVLLELEEMKQWRRQGQKILMDMQPQIEKTMDEILEKVIAAMRVDFQKHDKRITDGEQRYQGFLKGYGELTGSMEKRIGGLESASEVHEEWLKRVNAKVNRDKDWYDAFMKEVKDWQEHVMAEIAKVADGLGAKAGEMVAKKYSELDIRLMALSEVVKNSISLIQHREHDRQPRTATEAYPRRESLWDRVKREREEQHEFTTPLPKMSCGTSLTDSEAVMAQATRIRDLVSENVELGRVLRKLTKSAGIISRSHSTSQPIVPFEWNDLREAVHEARRVVTGAKFCAKEDDIMPGDKEVKDEPKPTEPPQRLE